VPRALPSDSPSAIECGVLQGESSKPFFVPNALTGRMMRLAAKSPGGCRMEPSDLLALLARTFEGLQIAYLVTGSMATIAYGEPRFTNDVSALPHQKM
jgi:hypothetical protein